MSRKPTKNPTDFVTSPGTPPSPSSGVTKATQAKRHKMRDFQFTPANTAFDRHNPERKGSFHGFFALFWLAYAFLVLKTVAEHWRQTGSWHGGRLVAMYRLNVWDLVATDAVMVCSSVFCYALQVAVFRGLSWPRYGWYIQFAWQSFYIGNVIFRSYYGDWQWIQSVCIILHCCVMLMKQHSYAMYMGYLAEMYKRRKTIETHLAAVHDSNAKRDEHELALLGESKEIEEELTLDGVTYPENLTLWNFVDYLLVPSLVYDITYPRTERVRWTFVLEKTLAAIGVFGLMTLIVEHYILPVLPPNHDLMTTQQKLEELPWLMLKLVFPFISLYLLTFYMIFETVCQWFAEVTRFADRNFYNDWWNAVTWDEFARDWNVPVHRFLLRHVYHSSISTLHVHKQTATLITFVLSSVIHELVMACMTKKIRFYLLTCQMLQLPLVMISRSRLFRQFTTAGNVFFWFGLFCGPSFLCLAYLLF